MERSETLKKSSWQRSKKASKICYDGHKARLAGASLLARIIHAELRIEGRALRIEGNGPVLGCGLLTDFLERTPGKNASAELSP
ncbi:MAG TPA: hypothetical protein VMO00_07960 [Methylomirabilota bacterium]|nr:hypothetical protein [Methylomirabilota bacterium]